MSNLDLTDNNIMLYAAKYYTNNQCKDVNEFYSDMDIPLHLKKLFTRYQVNKELKERLIINHLISFFNVFQSDAAMKLLFYKIDGKHYTILKTFLIFMNRCPDFLKLNGQVMNINIIPLDKDLLEKLKNAN